MCSVQVCIYIFFISKTTTQQKHKQSTKHHVFRTGLFLGILVIGKNGRVEGTVDSFTYVSFFLEGRMNEWLIKIICHLNIFRSLLCLWGDRNTANFVTVHSENQYILSTIRSFLPSREKKKRM